MMLDRFADIPLIFVTGKGGVGKSTVTAALGRAMADRGRRVLVVETDTFSAMNELLGAETTDSEPVALDEHLSAVNLRATDCFVKALNRFVPSERVARAVVNNRVARVFFNAAPSVNEFAILDHLSALLEPDKAGRRRYDHVIVDLPASGHAVTFLGVPQTLRDMMSVGPIAKRCDEIAADIKNPSRTAVVAVCLPEEMPVNETIELSENLERTIGRPLDAVFVNMVHALPVDARRREAFERLAGEVSTDAMLEEADAPLDKFVAGNALALGWHDRDRHYLSLLAGRIAAPIVELPVVYAEETASIVSELAERLSRPGSDGEETLAS